MPSRHLFLVFVEVDDDHPEAQGDEWEMVSGDIPELIGDYSRMMSGPAVEIEILSPIELSGGK